MIKHTLSYQPGHPNPQKYRRDYELLNGYWSFVFDEEDKGLDRQYQHSFPQEHLQIVVPYPYQSPASEVDLPDRQCDVIWYEREFNIDDLEKRHVITFNSVDYKSEIFINGELVCEHEGCYDIFSVDATPYVHKGKNKLTLRIVDELDIDQIRGKQRWRKKSFTCFYTETSGIVRDVYIEHLGDSYIEDIMLRADYLTKTFSMDATVNGETAQLLRVELFASDGEQVLCREIKGENGSYSISAALDHVRGWCHEDPYLYDIKLSLLDGGEVIDEVLSYVGFKTVETRDRHFYINGKDTYLKFVLNQGYWPDTITTPTEEQMIGDVKLTLACGFNGARMHEHTPSPLNFYYMDLYGLYAWQECPSAHGYSYKAQKQYYKQFPRIIRDHFNHPCIMAYVLFNESWGINEIRESEEMCDMTADMYRLAKEKVGDRLVISNDGWEHTVSDVLTFHNYAESYETLRDFFEPNLRAIYNGENAECIDNYKNFYALGYRYGGQPVMFSEFAGIAFSSDTATGWGYGDSVGTQEDFLNKYSGQLRFIAERDEIRGFCMTQITDVFQEKNGLFTMEREEKVNIEEIKRMHDEFK